MNKKHVLISGASLAGLTLAYWLHKYGFQVTIVERASGLRMGGNGVDVQDQALEVIDQMGLLSSVQAMATDVKGMAFVDSKHQDSTIQLNMQAIQQKQKSGQIEIMRGDLIELLYSKVKGSVTVVFGDTITAFSQTDSGVHVTFEKGNERDFDLVVGADGIHSNVRKIGFGPEQQFARYLGYYMAFANAPSDLSENKWMTIYNEPGRMAGLYRSGNHLQAKSYFLFRQPKMLAYDYRNTDEQKKMLRRGMKAMGWRTDQLLESAFIDPDFYFDSLSQIRMSQWSTGRIVLVGDAAYCASPVTGAGALLALVGAYRLAGELFAAGEDFVEAYKQYEIGMRPLVKRKQAQPFTALLAPKTRIGIWARNLTVRLPALSILAGLERRMEPKRQMLPVYR